MILNLSADQLAAEQRLMALIRDRWGALARRAIEDSTFKIQESFLAALIANESGGDPAAKRLENSVFASLIKVSQGREPRWGSITLSDIQQLTYDELMDLSTSWGLTQVMGYQVLGMQRPASDLAEPEFNLTKALYLLGSLTRRWKIDAAAQPEKLFDSWNTGRPSGKTYDPDYVPRAILRMGIYEKLLKAVTSDK